MKCGWGSSSVRSVSETQSVYPSGKSPKRMNSRKKGEMQRYGVERASSLCRRPRMPIRGRTVAALTEDCTAVLSLTLLPTPPSGPMERPARAEGALGPDAHRRGNPYVTALTSLRNCFHDWAGDCLCCSTRWIALETAVWMSPWWGPRICGFSFRAEVAKIFPTGALLKNGFLKPLTAALFSRAG